MENKEPLRLPAFEKVIGFAVQKALEDWRDEALEGESLLPSCIHCFCLPSGRHKKLLHSFRIVASQSVFAGTKPLSPSLFCASPKGKITFAHILSCRLTCTAFY